MTDQERTDRLYHELLRDVVKFHKENQRRIHKGLISLAAVPMVFLVLVFLTDSSKVIFLLLWIVSLFGISAYLIAVEYIDYEMQNKLRELALFELSQWDSLLEMPQLEEWKTSFKERVRRVEQEIMELQTMRDERKEPGDLPVIYEEPAEETPPETAYPEASATEEIAPAEKPVVASAPALDTAPAAASAPRPVTLWKARPAGEKEIFREEAVVEDAPPYRPAPSPDLPAAEIQQLEGRIDALDREMGQLRQVYRQQAPGRETKPEEKHMSPGEKTPMRRLVPHQTEGTLWQRLGQQVRESLRQWTQPRPEDGSAAKREQE